MSYVRFGADGSDVYVYADVNGYLNCCGCPMLENFESSSFNTTEEMLAHLQKHKDVGHHVPDFCIEGLKKDAVENDAWIAKVQAGQCTGCDGTGECRDYQPHDPRKPLQDCAFCKGSKLCYRCDGAGGSPEWVAIHGRAKSNA